MKKLRVVGFFFILGGGVMEGFFSFFFFFFFCRCAPGNSVAPGSCERDRRGDIELDPDGSRAETGPNSQAPRHHDEMPIAADRNNGQPWIACRLATKPNHRPMCRETTTKPKIK